MKRSMLASIIALALAGHGTARAQDWEDPEAGDDSSGGDEAGASAGGSAEANVAVNASTGSKLGIGVASTVSGIVGAEVEFHMGDQLMIVGDLVLDFTSPDEGDSVTTILLGGGAFFRLAGTGDTALYGGGRLLIANSDPGTQINLEIPARVQVWLSNMFAIHLETGLVVAFIPEEGVVAPPGIAPDSLAIVLDGSLFGSAGFTLYWP